MSDFFPRSHSGYQQLSQPLPSAEDRLYPSLELRDHRVLPPPADAQVTIAAPLPQPSAPVFGVVSHAPQQQMAFLSNSAVHNPPMNVQYQPPMPRDPQAYAPLHEAPPAMNVQYAMPAQAPLPAPATPFLSDNAHLAVPSIEELTARIKGSAPTYFSIQSMFTHSWRFYTKNFCSVCGTQLFMLIFLFLFAFASMAFVHNIHNQSYNHRKSMIFIFLFEFGLVSLFVFPMFLALAYATLRGIQQNRLFTISEFFKFFSLHYCSFFMFSFLNSLMLSPYFGPVSVLLQFVYLLFFSFAIPMKMQFPNMCTFKAWGLSARVSGKNFCKMLLLTILVLLMNFLAFVLLFVGMFITVPLTFGIYVFLYHKLVGMHSVSGYALSEGRADEYAYDGTGANPDLPRPPQMPMPMSVPQPQPQLQLQPQRMQYVQLVPVMHMRNGAQGMVQVPVVSASAPGGPMVMRPVVQSV